MVFEFDIFELDTIGCELRAPDGPIPIPPKAFAVLVFLVENAERMVSKSELMDGFWPPNATEASLQTTLSIIRKALRQAGATDPILKTVHGQGVRCLADVRQAETAPTTPLAASPAMEEQRTLAVMCLQIKTSSGKDQIADALPTVATRAEELVTGHHGQLLHMMIDGFTAVFGLGPMQEDAVRRATSTAFELIESCALPPQTGLSIGVACGPVALVDTHTDTDWAPPSDIERDAAALARAATISDVLVADAALTHLRGEVPITKAALGHRVLSAPSHRAGVPTTASAAQLVGRTAELAFLQASAQALRDGTGQAITLSGPAGIGKSRLLGEFLTDTHTADTPVIVLNCLPRLNNTPLAPIRDLVMQLGPHPALDDPVDAALLNRMLGEPASPVLAGLSDVAMQQQSCAVLQALVTRACDEHPLIVVFEDVHWMDATSITHLEALVRTTDTAPLLILLSSRPTDNADLTDAALHLPPLGLNDSLSLLQNMPAMQDVTRHALRALAERASGNPFFLEELALSHLVGSPSLPGTVLAVIENRVSQLPMPLRRVLYCVVTIGPPAPVDLIAHLLGQDGDTLRPDLIQLMRLGFLREDADGVLCRHMLLSDTAYAMIAPADRKRLHREIANYLSRSADPSLVRPELLALHLQEAGDIHPAVENWTRASNAALSRAAAEEAITFARNGLDLLTTPGAEHPGLEIGLHLSVAPALMATRGYGAPEAGDAFRQAHRLNATLGIAKVQPRILLGLWLHSWVAGNLTHALDHARALETIAKGLNKPGLSLQAFTGIGSVLTHMGHVDAARDQLLAGLEVLGTKGPDSITTQNSAVTCASYAAWTAALVGDHAAVDLHVSQSEALSKTFNNPFAQAIHFSLCSDVYLLSGDVARCRAFAKQAATLSETHNYPFWLGTALVLEGITDSRQGAPDRGLELIDQGIAVFKGTGAGIQLANWYGLKAEAHLTAGQPDQACHNGKVALDHAKRTEDVWFNGAIHSTLATAYAQRGDTTLADHHTLRAREQGLRLGSDRIAD